MVQYVLRFVVLNMKLKQLLIRLARQLNNRDFSPQLFIVAWNWPGWLRRKKLLAFSMNLGGSFKGVMCSIVMVLPVHLRYSFVSLEGYSSFFTVYFCRVLLSISTMLQHEVMLFERVGSVTLSVSGNTIWA
jgi:hypothetical protein